MTGDGNQASSLWHRPDLAPRLRAGEGLTGMVLKMPAPALVELAGHIGFDLIVLDTEHGPADGSMLEDHLRAAASAGIPAIVRVTGNNPAQILHALDGGAAGIIVPHVDTADQAAAAASAAHYPPHGSRGFALSTRAGRYGTAKVAEHLQQAEQRTLVIAQIENATAIPNVGAIAATPRLDALWIGPSDLSLSLGHPGQPAHPDVVAAIDHIAAHLQAAGNSRLCVLARDENDARQWRRRGAAIVLFSAIDIIAARFAALTADALRQPLGLSPDGALQHPAQPANETN